ncbi:HNH endonuclease [Cronobacter dublinensis]
MTDNVYTPDQFRPHWGGVDADNDIHIEAYDRDVQTRLEAKSVFLAEGLSTYKPLKASNQYRIELADTATDSAGYRRVSVRIEGKTHMLYAHRVAFIIANGGIPTGMQTDHINGIRDDNRLINLRAVTPQENQHNYRKAKGYSRHSCSDRWEAYIRVDGVRHHLGLFTNEAAARAAYLKAKARYHPSTPADLLQAA